MPDSLRFYIDGAWVDPAGEGQALDVIDPATERACGRVALGAAADVDRAVAAARLPSPPGPPPRARCGSICSNA